MSFENQGIVDGRQAGSNPSPAPVTLDTYIDEDASAPHTSAADTLTGATSQDVHKPLGDMTSKQEHHDGHDGRKKMGDGVDQWGTPGTRKHVLEREERDKQKTGEI
ncbi:hypothetical protein FIBSPDRAFT_877774 [Athelia psychrophila]|uniref:Uncharacterized protein n=1 Tax=Athelia psychrophila TaxID=1759441 RepID=A0A167VNU1_9AGAM|nr:hypothetical protein FIBSPDRAFT_877774 [Fibularhizoctonia sp. CBS 109695]